ncbi:MAG: recombinase family protein [Gordonia sp. (in: high G+C Gram-positive bacteria)]
MPFDESTAVLLGYARAGTGGAGLPDQIAALTAAGVAADRVYTDAAGDPTAHRPGLADLLDYARRGDTVVVVGIDRLGRVTDEVMRTVRDLAHRGLRLRCLRERIDTDEAAGHMIIGVLASLAELDGDHRPALRRPHRGGGTVGVGRPRALTDEQIAQAERLRARGQPVPIIAAALGVSRATLYRSLAAQGARK